MKIHRPFDEEPDFAHRPPPHFAAKIEPILARLMKVEVELLDKHNKGEPVNGLDLDVPDKPEDAPELETRELIQILLEMASVDAEQRELEEPQLYRARLTYWNKSRTEARKTFLRWTWDPYEGQEEARPREQAQAIAASRQAQRRTPGPSDPYAPMEHDESSWRAEYQFNRMAQMEEQMMRMFSLMMGQVDAVLKTILSSQSQANEENRKDRHEHRQALKQANAETNKAQDRLFRMALHVTQHNEQQEAINQRALEMFQAGYTWFWYSQQQMQRAAERRHAEEIERLRRQKKDEGRLDLIAKMGPAAIAFAASVMQNINPQLGAWLESIAQQRQQQNDAAASTPPGFEGGGAPSGFESSPGGGTPPGFEGAQAAAPPSNDPAQQAADAAEAKMRAEIDALSMAERARKFVDGFSTDALVILRDRLGDELVDMIENFAKCSTDQEVCIGLYQLTNAIKSHPTADIMLNDLVSKNQFACMDSIAAQMQRMAEQGPIVSDAANDTPAQPDATGQPQAAPQPDKTPKPEPEPEQTQRGTPTPPGGLHGGPMPPSGPTPGPAGPPGFDLAPPGFDGPGAMQPPSTASTPRRKQTDPLAEERARARLDRILDDLPKIPAETRTELIDGWGSVDAVREADDADLLALRGIGPAWLSKLKDRLSKA